jgi:hypothetical protein
MVHLTGFGAPQRASYCIHHATLHPKTISQNLTAHHIPKLLHQIQQQHSAMPRTKTTKKKPEKRPHGVTTPVSLESTTTRSRGLENSSTSPLAAVARSVSHALGFGATSDASGDEVGKGEESNNESSNDDDYPFNIYYDGNGGVFEFESGRLPSDIDYIPFGMRCCGAYLMPNSRKKPILPACAWDSLQLFF